MKQLSNFSLNITAMATRKMRSVQFEFREITGTIELEIQARQTKWSELWSTPENRWRMFIMIVSGFSFSNASLSCS